MSELKERRSNIDRRQAAPIKRFPIFDANGILIECDRRSGIERRDDPRTTVQFINAKDFLAKLADLHHDD
jgi:hypothetical protein